MSEEEIHDGEVIPLVESAAAQIAAWGCLFPIGYVLLVAGVVRLIDYHFSGAIWFGAGSMAALVGCAFILIRQRYSPHKLGFIAALGCCVLAAIGWHVWNSRQAGRELDLRFAKVINNASAIADGRVSKAPKLAKKVLPIVRTRFGDKNKADSSHVFQELYSELPTTIRAESAEDVKTVILVDWTYQLIGHYVSTDLLKIQYEKVFQGGCRIKAFDMKSNQIIHDYHFLGPDSAPKFRDADDTTVYYGLQPSEAEVIRYIMSLPFE